MFEEEDVHIYIIQYIYIYIYIYIKASPHMAPHKYVYFLCFYVSVKINLN
jgi:hypothetical protein